MVTVRVKTDPVKRVTSTMWSRYLGITGLYATDIAIIAVEISIDVYT